MKRYTFVTTYIVEATHEAKARETMEKVESQLRPDAQVAEMWTRLIDIKDQDDLCPGGDACSHGEENKTDE